MVSFASRYRMPTSIRKDRPLTNDELQRIVPSAFSEEKHDSRSERYTYIPTIVILDRLRDEGFQPYYATQSRTRDQDKRDFTKHMLRLRRHDQINGKEVPEIILLNSHDGSSSYKMIPVCSVRFVMCFGCMEGFWRNSRATQRRYCRAGYRRCLHGAGNI